MELNGTHSIENRLASFSNYQNSAPLPSFRSFPISECGMFPRAVSNDSIARSLVLKKEGFRQAAQYLCTADPWFVVTYAWLDAVHIRSLLSLRRRPAVSFAGYLINVLLPFHGVSWDSSASASMSAIHGVTLHGCLSVWSQIPSEALGCLERSKRHALQDSIPLGFFLRIVIFATSWPRALYPFSLNPH